MNNDTLLYLEQRLEESAYDLYETVAPIRKIRIAKFIDFLIFASGIALFVSYTVMNELIPNIFVFVSVVAFIVLHFLIKGFMRGQTAGYLIMGIRFVNVHSKKEVSLREYLNYVKKTTRMEIRYTEIVRYYLNYNGRLNQNQPMRRFGMILVNAPQYKKFYKDYIETKERYQDLLQQLA